MSKVYMYGIDISTWQGNINLAPYKKQFVIIRAGFDLTTDNKAVRNMNECDRLGIPYGVYWYSYALNASQAVKEAEACLRVIKGRNIRVGVWLDMEDADHYKSKHGVTSASRISAICKAFCQTIEKAGYYTGIYASASWFGSKIVGCDMYDKWVASWGSNNGKLQNDTSGMGTLHQYTSKPLDKNVMYVPLSTYQSKAKPVKKKTVDELAKEVLDGKWGTGDERKKKLTAAGYDYDAVQARVNELLKPKKTVAQLAQEVIDGKWGTGKDREKRLTEAGYSYKDVQAKVNEILANKGTAKIMTACKEQSDWMRYYTYKWEPRPTIPKSKKKGTCVTYVACVLQRLGVLKSGQYIWMNGKGFGTGKVTGAINNKMDVKYMGNKTLSSLKSQLKQGDIIMVDDNKSGKKGDGGHIFILTGSWSGSNPYIWDNNTAKHGCKPLLYKGSRKALVRIRLKSFQ